MDPELDRAWYYGHAAGLEEAADELDDRAKRYKTMRIWPTNISSALTGVAKDLRKQAAEWRKNAERI